MNESDREYLEQIEAANRRFRNYVASELTNAQAMIAALTDLVRYELAEKYQFSPEDLQKMVRKSIEEYRIAFQSAPSSVAAPPPWENTGSENN